MKTLENEIVSYCTNCEQDKSFKPTGVIYSLDPYIGPYYFGIYRCHGCGTRVSHEYLSNMSLILSYLASFQT